MTKRRRNKRREKGIQRCDFWWDKYQFTNGDDGVTPYRNIIIGNAIHMLKRGILQNMEARFSRIDQKPIGFENYDLIIRDKEEDFNQPKEDDRYLSLYGRISSIIYAQWCTLHGYNTGWLESQYEKSSPSQREIAYHFNSNFENYGIIAKWLYHEQPSAVVTDLMAKAFADMDTDNVPTELLQMPFDSFYIHLETPMMIDWKPDHPNFKVHPNDNKIVGFLVADGRKEPIQGPLQSAWQYSHRPCIKVIALRESYTQDGEYHDGLINSDEWRWFLDGETIGEGHPKNTSLKERRANNCNLHSNRGRTGLYMEQAQNIVINALLYLNATNRKVREEKVWGDAHKRFEFLWQAQLLLLKAKAGGNKKEARRAKEVIGRHKRSMQKHKAGHVFWIDEHKDESSDTNGDKLSHASPTTHWRRAHWHSFRYGAMKREDGTSIPKDKRPLRLKFLPPVRIKGRKKKEDTPRAFYGMRMFTPENQP